jgi:hypothetical protein
VKFRLGKVERVELVVRSIVTHSAHAVRSRKHALIGVSDDSIGGPAALPQFVDDRHIVFGDLVTIVVRALTLFTHAFRCAVEIAGYDVPADPALCQVIEGGHPARERERRFVGERNGYAKAEVLCGCRHGWDEKQRIVDRGLRSVQQGGLGTAAKDVVDAENVGEKQAIEEPSLQCLREFDLAVEAPVIARAVAGVAPHPGRLMRDAVHLERVEADFLGHGVR